jgi:hypothetical protein
MNEEQLNQRLKTLDIDSREDTLWSLVGQFYSRQMQSTVIFTWTMGLVILALCAAMAVLFFHAEQIRWQIVYAVLFVVFMEWLSIIKIFAWLMIHRNNIKREIKRLELRIAELAAARK